MFFMRCLLQPCATGAFSHKTCANSNQVQRVLHVSIINLIEENDRLALTYKKSANQVFSFGRDHGFYGRILNQAVFPRDSIQVREKNGSYEIAGSCLTPQDGNSLLSSVSASLWLLNPETYNKDLQCLKSYFFEEV